MPAQYKTHKHQRRRVKQRIAHPERQRTAHRHLLAAQPGGNRRSTAGAHHARQREERAEQRTADSLLAQGTQQPVAGNKHLHQRAEKHAQHRGFPDREEVDHGIVERGPEWICFGVSKDGLADAVGFCGGKGFTVIGLPFHIPEPYDHDEKKERGLPPLDRCCRLR